MVGSLEMSCWLSVDWLVMVRCVGILVITGDSWCCLEDENGRILFVVRLTKEEVCRTVVDSSNTIKRQYEALIVFWWWIILLIFCASILLRVIPLGLSKVTDTEQFEFNKEVSVTNKAGLVPWSLALVWHIQQQRRIFSVDMRKTSGRTWIDEEPHFSGHVTLHQPSQLGSRKPWQAADSIAALLTRELVEHWWFEGWTFHDDEGK